MDPSHRMITGDRPAHPPPPPLICAPHLIAAVPKPPTSSQVYYNSNSNDAARTTSGGRMDFQASQEEESFQEGSTSASTYEVTFNGNEQLSVVHLQWSFFHPNMVNLMMDFRNAGTFIDLTISVENEMIPCHKLVLASCSTYFEEILTSKLIANNPHPVVVLKDLRLWEVLILVDFMYRGEMKVREEDLNAILEASKKLGIKGLWAQNAFGGQSVSDRSEEVFDKVTLVYSDVEETG